jgi:hypothetical protein
LAADCRRAGDREFGRGAGELEEQHLADGVSEVQPLVEDVGGLRQVDTGDPGGDARRDEDDELWRCAAKADEEASRAYGRMPRATSACPRVSGNACKQIEDVCIVCSAT